MIDSDHVEDIAADPIPDLIDPAESDRAIEPASLKARLRTTATVGAWVGAALGWIGFLVGTAFWAQNAVAVGEGPYSAGIVVAVPRLILGAALISIPFGAVSAGVARASAAGQPGMRLRSSPAVTAWVGAAFGACFGSVAGAVLGALGAPTDSPGSTQLPVVATLATMVLGGAVLGAGAAALTQFFALPAVLPEGTEADIMVIRGRLRDAVRIPLTALLVIVFLVIPLGLTLVEASHLSEFAAPVIAMVIAAGILGFAALSTTRPNMRITTGEFGVALVGILVVVGLVLAVMFERGPAAPEAHGPGGTVDVTATADFTFEPPEWSVAEGQVHFVYHDDADTVHTLVIEGMEDLMELRVDEKGAVDEGTVNLPPGSYTLFCTIKGHRELGMEGQLIVERAPGDEAPVEQG